jgi:hypothetical protein
MRTTTDSRAFVSPRLLMAFGAVLAACSAGANDGVGSVGSSGEGGSAGGSTVSSGGEGQGGSGPGQGGGFSTGMGTGGMGGSVPVNPCGTECGPMEICDGAGKGLDDNCNGEVDEGCPCSIGQASSCFKGDPSFRDYPGCFPGTMSCTENGNWGPCTGGTHATPDDQCQLGNAEACHPISAVPFATTDLFQGTGTFDDNADPGSSLFEVACPSGVQTCPTVQGASSFQALQSGQYDVTYTKSVNGTTESCTFPLYVGAPGLRVELSWNWGGFSKDLDLHLHKPGAPNEPMLGWSPTTFGGATEDDGTWWNCTANDYSPPPSGPEWFPPGVNWTLNPEFNANTCYFAPRGVGQDWQDIGMGCHNPRLDLDNISCTSSITDPQDSSFCAPENTNVDIPPWNEWFRVGVFGYTVSGSLTPTVKIWCNGELGAELGPVGYDAPIAIPSRQMWLAADVLFTEGDECTPSQCVVRPLYVNDDTTAKQPVFLTETQANMSFGSPGLAPLP